METAAAPGKDTTEYRNMKWIMWGAGVLATGCTAAAAILPAIGLVPATSAVVVVLGSIALVLSAVAGKVGVEYSKDRAQIKAEALKHLKGLSDEELLSSYNAGPPDIPGASRR